MGAYFSSGDINRLMMMMVWRSGQNICMLREVVGSISAYYKHLRAENVSLYWVFSIQGVWYIPIHFVQLTAHQTLWI
jgi:hypothetical protein